MVTIVELEFVVTELTGSPVTTAVWPEGKLKVMSKGSSEAERSYSAPSNSSLNPPSSKVYTRKLTVKNSLSQPPVFWATNLVNSPGVVPPPRIVACVTVPLVVALFARIVVPFWAYQMVSEPIAPLGVAVKEAPVSILTSTTPNESTTLGAVKLTSILVLAEGTAVTSMTAKVEPISSIPNATKSPPPRINSAPIPATVEPTSIPAIVMLSSATLEGTSKMISKIEGLKKE